MQQAAEHRAGVVLVTAAAVAWSLAGFFTRLIPLDAWTILAWRGLFGALFLGLYVVWRYRGRTLAVTWAMGWPGLLVTFLSALGMTSFIPALKLTSVADVAIIYAACPFLAAGLAWIWYRERVTRLTLGASLLAFAGVALTVSGAGTGRSTLAGDLLAGVMTLALAAMTVALRRYRDVPMLPTASLANMLGALVGLVLGAPLAAGAQDLAYLALFGFVQMSLGLGFFTLGSRLIPAAETALISALETPLAPLWVWLAFGEAVSPHALAGGAVVMAAVMGHVLLQGRRRLVKAAGCGSSPGTAPWRCIASSPPCWRFGPTWRSWPNAPSPRGWRSGSISRRSRETWSGSATIRTRAWRSSASTAIASAWRRSTGRGCATW